MQPYKNWSAALLSLLGNKHIQAIRRLRIFLILMRKKEGFYISPPPCQQPIYYQYK